MRKRPAFRLYANRVAEVFRHELHESIGLRPNSTASLAVNTVR